MKTITETPKYYLADVPQDLRRRVLDLCFKRLWHEGLELLQQNGIHHYDRDDLMNFYSWAPTILPNHATDAGCVPQEPNQPQHAPPPPAANLTSKTNGDGWTESRPTNQEVTSENGPLTDTNEQMTTDHGHHGLLITDHRLLVTDQ